MKKVLLVAAVAVLGLTTAAVANNGGKGKDKTKAKTECTKGEKKACCASKSSCSKPATPAK